MRECGMSKRSNFQPCQPPLGLLRLDSKHFNTVGGAFCLWLTTTKRSA